MTKLRRTSDEAIQKMDKHYRTQFINSLTGFKSAALVGSISEEGITNLAIFSQIFHLGARPALIGMIVRPASVPRNTLLNITSTGVYTINHIQAHFIAQAHQTSARYGPELSEFDEVGLTPEYLAGFSAPFVAESKVKIGLELVDKIDIAINETILLIGKIVEVITPEDCLMSDGFIDIEKAGTITVSGLDSYHKTKRLERFSYAKPNVGLKSLLNNE